MLALTHPTSRRGFIEFAKNPAPVEESRDLSSNIEEEEETREADEYVPKSSSSVVIEEDETNFIRLLIKVEEDERMKNVKHKVGWILDQLQNCLGEDQVGRWRRKNQSSILSQEEELEKKNQEKRLAAKKRQEAIMQQFAKAQSAFLESVEGEDEGDDDDEDDYLDDGEEKDEVRMRDHKIDFGTCIVCQDELEESKAFGILGLVQGSNLIRLSPTGTDNLVFQQEILSTPSSLDRDASLLRPFGIASEKIRVHSFDESGDGIARGYPQSQKSGFHASSCGHLMHLSCFETYCDSLSTRHRQQPTRCHPETIERKEFVCPLCKSLGNVLLPATPDAPAFLPYTDSLDNRSLVDWSNSTGEEQDEETLAQVDRLQLINDLDGSILFKPWRISLSLPAALTTHFGNREGLMIARLLQVVTALKHEVGHSSGGGIVTLTQDLLGYTIASIEVASRGTSDPSWKIGESSLRIIQSLFTTMQHVMEAMSPSLEDSRRISAIAIRQRLGGYFARGTKFENVEFTRFDPLGSVIEAAACTPSIFYHVVSVSFYTFLAQSLVGVFRLFHQSSTLAEWKGDYDSDEAKLYLSLAEIRCYFNSPALFDPESTAFHLTLGKHLYSQVLPFLRRVAIVARVVFGEPSNLSSQSEGTEFERLLELLQIPHPNTVLPVEPSSSALDESIQLLRTHLSDCARSATYLQGFDLISTVDKLINSSAPEIEHSTIYELLGLPHHLDTLITSSLERKCERCEQTPENPAICLFCGELVCCQSFCCMAGEEEAQHGECNEHMWT
jgi:E3 ubiquitin-protein ligase UBR1